MGRCCCSELERIGLSNRKTLWDLGPRSWGLRVFAGFRGVRGIEVEEFRFTVVGFHFLV